MAAISPDDCTITVLAHSGLKVIKVVTPATADDGDTVDLSSYFENGFLALIVGSTDGHAVETKTSYDATLTIPGATDNEARTAICIGE